MATLDELSKEQLIELLNMATNSNEKHIKVLKYITTQIAQKPQHPRGYIDLPIKEVTNQQLSIGNALAKLHCKKAVASNNPNDLYVFMKTLYSTDHYTI